jgi:hypothetical protein
MLSPSVDSAVLGAFVGFYIYAQGPPEGRFTITLFPGAFQAHGFVNFTVRIVKLGGGKQE